jgi:hypothetical protein
MQQREVHQRYKSPPPPPPVTPVGPWTTCLASWAYTVLVRPWVLQEVEAPRISRQWAHENRKIVSPTHQQLLTPRRRSWLSFLSEAEWTVGPKFDQKDYAKEKSQQPHRESKPRQSAFISFTECKVSFTTLMFVGQAEKYNCALPGMFVFARWFQWQRRHGKKAVPTFRFLLVDNIFFIQHNTS